MRKFYVLNNKIIHLSSIRDIALAERENRLYINYQVGDIRTEILQFQNREETEKAFTELCLVLTSEG